MLNGVQSYMQEHNMIAKGDRIVIGVSGGADSVCLFHVLLKLASDFDLTLFVVHVNHGIRGYEADEDEAYVKELCEKNDISFYGVKVSIPDIVRLEGLSEEEAGRKVRYEAFYHCFEKNKCNKIAIAHNRNDNAETILFHLFRGSGIKGLTGIHPMRDQIIRPLLQVGRDEIENYLEQNLISYRTDQTNLTEDYSRNKIRHRIIRYAQEEINPKVIHNIVNAAGQLNEINQYLEYNIKRAFEKIVVINEEQKTCVLDLELLRLEDIVIQKGIIRRCFLLLAHQLKDVEALHVNLVISLMEKEVGKSLNLPYHILAVKGYHDIIMKVNYARNENQNANHKNEINKPNNIVRLEKIVGSSNILETNKTIEQEIRDTGDYDLFQSGQFLRVKLINYEKSMIILKNGCTKWFDYDKIKNTVLIRTRNEGDFIQIDSKGSRKKIKSLFIDDKVPREKRNSQPLLADGSHIMWVIGGRMSEAYKVSEETKVILEISLCGGQRDGR